MSTNRKARYGTHHNVCNIHVVAHLSMIV